MATLKRRVDDTRAASDAVLTVDNLLTGLRPTDPEAGAVWRKLQRTIGEAALGTGFDPRVLLRLGTEAERDEWTAARRQWIADLLRQDPRVVREDE